MKKKEFNVYYNGKDGTIVTQDSIKSYVMEYDDVESYKEDEISDIFDFAFDSSEDEPEMKELKEFVHNNDIRLCVYEFCSGWMPIPNTTQNVGKITFYLY